MSLRLFVFIFLCFISKMGFSANEITWNQTIDAVSDSIVSIKIDNPRAFDTEWKSSSQATGFVVDSKQGIILTNRHVVSPGPVRAEALFSNNEEVELTPIYRDPVHDFGFFRYDPKNLKHIKPRALHLDPSGVRVGQDIRVIGNDAGEKLSILAGIIARVDRPAPDYGRGNYNDFNTFYIQAASSTSGGSSGSPVINILGEVVALNAGANNSAASSYFLPLQRVKRALGLLKNNRSVKRGTLQTEFSRLTYDQLKKLDMTSATESLFWSKGKVGGLLAVKRVIKESPIYKFIKPGDILKSINGMLVNDFIELAAVLDENVGRSISIDIERGGQNINFSVEVSDLHQITPNAYLTFGGAVINDFSYQQARHYNRAIKGVYVADPGYTLSKSAIPAGAVIIGADGKNINNLIDFEKHLLNLNHEDITNIRYVKYSDPINSVLRPIEIDQQWFANEYCEINQDGYWPCRDINIQMVNKDEKIESTFFSDYKDFRKNAIAPALVHVNFDLPYPVAGIIDRHYYGTGLIIDKDKGLIIVDRNTVPLSMGEVKLTFAGSLEIPGKIEYIHPLHNFALLSYKTKSIGDTPVREATLNSNELKEGDQSWLVGLKTDHQLFYQSAVVASVDPLMLPASRSFLDTNIEVIDLINSPEDIYGVLANESGHVSALWSSFAYRSRGESYQTNRGISAELISDFIDQIKNNRPLYSLEIQLNYIPLFAARKLGLNDDWVSKYESLNKTERRLLIVKNSIAGSPASRIIKNGDILLSIDGKLISSFRDYEKASQKKNVQIKLWRENQFKEVTVSTVALNGEGIDDVFFWAGAHLHKPHRALNQRGIEAEGVYVAFNNYGSPATRYGLNAGQRIVAVDDVATPDLISFKKEVIGRKDRSSLRLRTISWNGEPNMVTLKLDNKYWPPFEIKKSNKEWKRNPVN